MLESEPIQMISRRATRVISVGDVLIGGSNPITVQSMCNTFTSDVKKTLSQISELRAAGCEIIRVAVPDMAAAEALPEICKQSPLPVVADIHFDYRLALLSAKAGVAKIRINPGNIGTRDRVKAVADACKERNIPIRIGVNSGSVDKHLLETHSLIDTMIKSALDQIAMLEELDFNDIALSIKSSSVADTVSAYRKISQSTNVPLHIGVTETGTVYNGVIKSAMGIGSLLLDGIGDTIRVSLTANPLEEIRAGLSILKTAGVRSGGINLISCPTCGRTKIDVISLAEKAEELFQDIKKPLTIAIMGCAVNGPGEARFADAGIAGGDGMGVIFLKGEIVDRAPENELLPRLLKLINSMGEA